MLVAASVADHPNHPQAAACLHSVRAKRIEAFISAHGLAEFYSVLTRTPFTPPIYPNEAWQLLVDDILPYFETVSLSSKDYTETIRKCADQGTAGGRLYDALHLRCAQKANCAKVYTFNIRHFQQLAPELAGNISAPLAV